VLLSNQVLKKFQSLHEKLGAELFSEPGVRLGRGFADLGFEEFVLGGSSKITSLYTGKCGDLPDEHRHFFFNIYDADGLVEVLINLGYDVDRIDYVEQRDWRIVLIGAEKKEHSLIAATLLDVLLDAALSLQEKK
jgi:hypothetical protein